MIHRARILAIAVLVAASAVAASGCVVEEEPPAVSRPGIAKATPGERVLEQKKRRSGARRE